MLNNTCYINNLQKQTTMFSITILDTICASTTIAVIFVTVLCFNEMFEQIDKSFTNLKTVKKILETRVAELEEENKNLKNNNVNDANVVDQTNNAKKQHSSGEFIAPEEINRILVEENRKLHVRCDMLEEELLKIREKHDGDRQVRFRTLTEM